MRRKYVLDVQIPEGITCKFENSTRTLRCKKEDIEIDKKISILGTDLKIENNTIKFICNKANKKDVAMIKAYDAHVRNMLRGLKEKFVYELNYFRCVTYKKKMSRISPKAILTGFIVKFL